MTYRLLSIAVLIELLTLSPVRIYAQPVVRQLTVSDANQTQFLLYSYDTDGRLLFERTQVEEDGVRTNYRQTEWVNSGDTLRLQRQWSWRNGKWMPESMIRTRFTNQRLISEEYILLEKEEEKLKELRKTDLKNGVETEEFFLLENNVLKLKQTTSRWLESNLISHTNHTYYTADTVSGWLISRTVRDSIGRIDSITTDLQLLPDSTREILLSCYYYDQGSPRLVSQVTRKWHPKAQVWENIQRVEYSYRNDGLIADEIYSYFTELRWLATHRYAYEYYPEGVLKAKILYGSIYRQWRKLSTVSYADLSQGYPRSVRSSYNFWGGEAGANASADLTYYFNGNQHIKRAHTIDIEYQDPSSLEAPEFDSRIRELVYPNPTNGMLFLRATGTLLVRWEVYDLQGRKVLAHEPRYSSSRIDLTPLPAGVYLVRVTDNQQQTAMQKITKY